MYVPKDSMLREILKTFWFSRRTKQELIIKSQKSAHVFHSATCCSCTVAVSQHPARHTIHILTAPPGGPHGSRHTPDPPPASLTSLLLHPSLSTPPPRCVLPVHERRAAAAPAISLPVQWGHPPISGSVPPHSAAHQTPRGLTLPVLRPQ